VDKFKYVLKPSEYLEISLRAIKITTPKPRKTSLFVSALIGAIHSIRAEKIASERNMARLTSPGSGPAFDVSDISIEPLISGIGSAVDTGINVTVTYNASIIAKQIAVLSLCFDIKNSAARGTARKTITVTMTISSLTLPLNARRKNSTLIIAKSDTNGERKINKNACFKASVGASEGTALCGPL
jgi:hypothetical protein